MKDTKVVVLGVATGGVLSALFVGFAIFSALLPGKTVWLESVMPWFAVLFFAPMMFLLLWSIKLIFDFRRQFNAAAEAAKDLVRNRTDSLASHDQQQT